MKHLVGLERQAFGLSSDEDPTPPPPKAEAKQPEDADFTRIREKFAKSIAAHRGVADVASKAAT